jgi:hypothetical protein
MGRPFWRFGTAITVAVLLGACSSGGRSSGEKKLKVATTIGVIEAIWAGVAVYRWRQRMKAAARS